VAGEHLLERRHRPGRAGSTAAKRGRRRVVDDNRMALDGTLTARRLVADAGRGGYCGSVAQAAEQLGRFEPLAAGCSASGDVRHTGLWGQAL
jgi:hypothetical protein